MDDVATWLTSLGIREAPCLDGKIHRVARDNRRGKSAWYVGWNDPTTVLAGDWRTGERWFYKSQGKMTRAERSTLRQRLLASRRGAEIERDRARQLAAMRAEIMLRSSTVPPPDHPYLLRKRIQPMGARLIDGELLIPMHGPGGILHGVQRILPTGEKLFLPGQRCEGCSFRIDGARDLVFICEGYATAVSIAVATSSLVYAAFSAGNLREIARQARVRFQQTRLVIAGDDDRWTDHNPGRARALEAAAAVGGEAVFPRFEALETRPTDFNDLHVMAGIEAVREQLMRSEYGRD